LTGLGILPQKLGHSFFRVAERRIQCQLERSI
jgi:hypothetical protein